MKKDKIYVATFSENAVEEIKNAQVNIELNHLCISQELDPENIEKTIEKMKKDILNSGAENVILHGPFTELCPASIDPRAVKLAHDRLNEAYKACKQIGVKKMVVHSGYMPLIYYKEWHVEKSIDFWKKYMEDKEDFTIYIENVFEDEPYMMAALCDAFDDERIKLCLDLGHANVMTQGDISVENWIEILGERIGHFHLHDNDGTKDLHNEIFQGTLDMSKLLRTIRNHCNSQVTYTIESKECTKSIKWLIDEK